MGVEDLGRLAERVAGLEGPLVRLGDDGSLPELVVDPADRPVGVPAVQPEHDPEGEEVLRQVLLLARHVEPVERPLVERRDRDLEERVLLERAVGQRVRRVAGLVEVLLGERVAVDDERAARRQVADVGLEGRRVHRDEHVRLVARRVDVARAETDLEAGDTGQRSGRRADLGREVGQRADVVAVDGRGPGELGPGQLHPIARIAGEADRDAVELLELRVQRLRVDRHPPSALRMRWWGRGGRLRSSSGNASARYFRMSCGRTTPIRWSSSSSNGHVPVSTGLHQLDRVADRLLEVEVMRVRRHHRLDRLVRGRRRRRRSGRRCRARSGRRPGSRPGWPRRPNRPFRSAASRRCSRRDSCPAARSRVHVG